MTSKERGMAAFAYREPDRMPCGCGASAEFWAKAKRESAIADDFRRVFARYAGPRANGDPTFRRYSMKISLVLAAVVGLALAAGAAPAAEAKDMPAAERAVFGQLARWHLLPEITHKT